MNQKLGHEQRQVESNWNIFDKKVSKRILGPVYDNEK